MVPADSGIGSALNPPSSPRLAGKILSIVIPVYRNEDTLQPLYARLRKTCEDAGLDYEAIFVVDGSPDGSAKIVKALAAQDQRVRIVELNDNVGQAAAVCRGLQHARGEATVVMDADLQDEPELIPRLLEGLRAGKRIVFAGKRGAYQPWHRLLTGRVYRILLSALADLPKDAGGFVAFDRQVGKWLLALGQPWPLLSAMLASSDFEKAAMAVDRPKRPVGGSSWTSSARIQAGLITLARAADFRLKAACGEAYLRLLMFFPLFFAGALLMSMLHGVQRPDEVWILQVARRLLAGEVLYRDVYYGATPLAAWVAGAFCKIFGLHVWSIKVYAALLQAGLCFLTGLLVLKASRDSLAALLATAAVYVYGYGNLESGPIYTPLASVFLLAALLLVFPNKGADKAGNSRPWLLKELVLSLLLSFGVLSKQNIGLAALGAWVLGYLYFFMADRPRADCIMGRPIVVLGLGAACSLGAMALALRDGALDGFLEYAVYNKGAYLQYAKISYLEEWGALFGRADWSFLPVLKDKFLRTQYFFPWVFCLIISSAVAFRPTERHRAVLLLLFCGAGLAGIFPRADLDHISFVAPFSVCGMAVGGYLLFPGTGMTRIGRCFGMILAIWLAAGFCTLLQPAREYFAGARVFSDIPAFYGAATSRNALKNDHKAAARLRETFGQRPMIIQSLWASYAYLLSGLQNSSPYDYPLKSVFGRTGERALVERIKAGEIAAVCYARCHGRIAPLEPDELSSYITTSMEEGRDLGICREYTRRIIDPASMAGRRRPPSF